MNIEVKDVGPCLKELTITVPRDRVRAAFDRNLAEAAHHLRLPGFRPGKAPKTLVQKRYGKLLLRDVKENLVTESFREAIDQEKIEPIRDPEVNFDSLEVDAERDFRWEVKVEIKPRFDLPDYKGVEVARPAAAVGDVEVDQAVEQVRRERATFELVEGGAGDGDLLIADVRLRAGDEELTRQGARVVDPAGGQIFGLPTPGLAAAAQGRRAGETVAVDGTLPANFHREDLRGRPVSFELAVSEVRRPKLPAADDAFAKELDYESLDDFRRDLRNRILRRKEEEADAVVERAILSKLLEATTFEAPSSLVEDRVRSEIRPFAMRLQQEEMPDEERQARLAQFEERVRLEATWVTRAALLLERIAEVEKVYVTEDEVEGYLREVSSRTGRSLAETQALYEAEKLLPHVRGTLRDRKTRARLRELARPRKAP